MAYPISVKKNNFMQNRKKSDIETPYPIAKFIYDLLLPYMNINSTILDICCGNGALSKPFKDQGLYTVGIDIKCSPAGNFDYFIRKDFLEYNEAIVGSDMILCNPPFNDDSGNKGRKLLPEVFFNKIIDVCGHTTPLVLFVPMGFRLNQRKKSARWQMLEDHKARITSIISLPIDAFNDVLFHSEILIFNVDGLESHYFIPKEYWRQNNEV